AVECARARSSRRAAEWSAKSSGVRFALSLPPSDNGARAATQGLRLIRRHRGAGDPGRPVPRARCERRGAVRGLRGGAVPARDGSVAGHRTGRAAPRFRCHRRAPIGARQSAGADGLRVCAARGTRSRGAGRVDRLDSRQLPARARAGDRRRRHQTRTHALRRRSAAHDRVADDAGRGGAGDPDVGGRASHAGRRARVGVERCLLDSAAVRVRGEPADAAADAWPLWLAAVVLTLASLGAALVSEWFVDALEPAIEALHISQAFAGLVIVAIAGNAVENVAGLRLAARNRPDYALSVILNSSLQIALVVGPALVLLSFVLGGSVLTLVLPPLLIAALLLTTLTSAIIVNDGETIWIEGVALIGLYGIIAAAFWWG